MRPTKRWRWRLGFHRVTLLQLRSGQPPEVRATYQRLRAVGVSGWRAWRLLTAVYEAEVAAMIVESRVYDHARFVALLEALPARPARSLRDVGPRAAI
jgi:aminoglycoside phosphotransferase (APT) family kinase protein